MALKLVKPGPVLRPYDKGVGGVTSTGWQTVTFDGNVYQTVEPGLYQFTMSGTKCSGLRLYFRSAADPRVNQYMLDTGVITGLGAPMLNAVIEMKEGDTFFGQVNGETSDTQVWLMTQKLRSLSLSLFVASAAAWLRRWQHGAKEDSSRPGGVFLQRRAVGNHGRHPGRVEDLAEWWPYLPAARRVLAGADGNLNRGITPLRTGREDRPAKGSNHKGGGLTAVDVCEKGRRAHAHTTGLTRVGGGC